MSLLLTKFIEQEVKHRLPGIVIEQTLPYAFHHFLYEGHYMFPPEINISTLQVQVFSRNRRTPPAEEQIICGIVHKFIGVDLKKQVAYLFHRGFVKDKGRIYGRIALAAPARGL